MKPGIMCVAGAGRDLLSGSGDDNVPAKRPTGKTCGYDGDCSQGVLTLSMSAFKGKADIPSSLANVG